jgi:hypothetical protein
VSDPGKGAFKGSSPVCIFTSPSHTGNFEWLPGAGANGSFAEIVAQPTLETVTGSKIGCVYLFVNGVITGGKTARISEVRMQQCEVLYTRVPCYTTSSEPGTIKSTIPLVGELGFIPGAVHPSSPRVGWDLRAESELSPTVVEFSCGQDQASRYEVSLKGSVIGRITKTNKMITSGRFELFYKEEKGIQNPTAFIAGPEDVLTQITTPVLDPSARQEEQVGLRGTGNRNSNGDNTGVLEVSEPIEIKAK